jgi:hypothetical protein
MPTPFVPGRDPKKRRREEKTRKHPKVIPSSISPLPNLFSSDHPLL